MSLYIFFIFIILSLLGGIVFLLYKSLREDYLTIKSHFKYSSLSTVILYITYTFIKISSSFIFYKICENIYRNTGGAIVSRFYSSDTFFPSNGAPIYEGNEILASLIAFAVYSLLVYIFFILLNKILRIKLFIHNIVFFIVFFIVFGVLSPDQKTPYEKSMEKMQLYYKQAKKERLEKEKYRKDNYYFEYIRNKTQHK